MNKIKKFIDKKGGILVLFTGIGLVLLASFLIVVGVIYGLILYNNYRW